MGARQQCRHHDNCKHGVPEQLGNKRGCGVFRWYDDDCNCLLSQNQAGNGGAIYNTGTLGLDSLAISSNMAKLGFGGAVYNAGTLTVNSSTLAFNQASGGSGGVGVAAGGDFRRSVICFFRHCRNHEFDFLRRCGRDYGRFLARWGLVREVPTAWQAMKHLRVEVGLGEYLVFSEAGRRAMRPSSGTVSSWMLKPLPSACAHALPMRIEWLSPPDKIKTGRARLRRAVT